MDPRPVSWKVFYSPVARQDDKIIRRKHRHLVARLEDILDTLARNPFEPSHNFEHLRGDLAGKCSRRLDSYNRVVYSVNGKAVEVLVLCCLGHYER